MSRNRNRANIQKTPEPQPQQIQNTPEPQQAANPLGLSFVVPTEIVYLPTAGNFYEEGSPCKGLESVEVRHMTAKEEDIITNQSFIQQGSVFERLIDSLVVTPGIKADDLMDCDKMAILASARKSGYGEEVQFQDSCDHCGTRQEFTANLGEFLDRAKENPYVIKDGEYWKFNPNTGTINVELSKLQLTVEIRLLSRRDFEFLKQSKIQKEKHNLPYSETIEFLRSIVISANGVSDKKTLNELIEVLPTVDARKLKYVHNINLPKFDTKTNVVCSSCSAELEKEVPFSVGWFWSFS